MVPGQNCLQPLVSSFNQVLLKFYQVLLPYLGYEDCIYFILLQFVEHFADILLSLGIIFSSFYTQVLRLFYHYGRFWYVQNREAR